MAKVGSWSCFRDATSVLEAKYKNPHWLVDDNHQIAGTVISTFSSTIPPEKVHRQQRISRGDSKLKIQNHEGRLVGTPFIGTEAVFTVMQHRRLARKIEKKVLGILAFT